MEDEYQIVNCPLCEGKTRIPTTYNGTVRCMRCAHQFTVAEGQIDNMNSPIIEPSPIVAPSEIPTIRSPQSKIISGISILLTFWTIILIFQLIIIIIANIPPPDIEPNENDFQFNTDLEQTEDSQFEYFFIAFDYLLVLAPASIHIYALTLISSGVKELFFDIENN